MRIIADLHVHSKYSRATSPGMNPSEICMWADKKGIDVIASGDFQHPKYLEELKKNLKESGNGLYSVKGKNFKSRLILSTEISNIFKQGGKVRKIHTVVIMPSLESAEKFSKALDERGNINSDGRPIFGFSAADLLKIAKDTDSDSMVIPAHVWTPWFSLFGSKSGFDSVEECYGKEAKHISALETGLSSDITMNRRVSALDNYAFVSNSDAHSPSKIGREANVLDCRLDYGDIKKSIESNSPKNFLYTIEFYPEEGKYHNDGHALCGINLHPREALANKNKCPVCFKPLTLGVLHRVEELADRPWDYKGNHIPQRHIIPLEEIIADSMGLNVTSKKVTAAYEAAVAKMPEFKLLLDASEDELKDALGARAAEGVLKVRRNEVNLVPGFDGEFGKISIFRKLEDTSAEPLAPKFKIQLNLFSEDE